MLKKMKKTMISFLVRSLTFNQILCFNSVNLYIPNRNLFYQIVKCRFKCVDGIEYNAVNRDC